MKVRKKAKRDLDNKFNKVLKTPEGFDFYIAIHDFVELIELTPCLLSNLSSCIKSNQELKISSKYKYLKKIHQGMKDVEVKSDVDLGHERYMTILELNKIKNKDVSENNSFWKKRELFRKSTGEIYEVLSLNLA